MVEIATVAEEKRTRPMSFSSEHVVNRWYGGEKLDHTPGAARMDFINSGRAPLLMGHDMQRQVGVIDGATIGKDKIGRATARFGRSTAAEDAMANVDDRIATNTSVGYRIHKMVLDSVVDGFETYRMTDWEPYEVSIVSVPADSSVGMGRNLEPPDPGDTPSPITEPTPEARQTRASSFSEPSIPQTEDSSMTTATTTAANTGTDGAADAAREAARVLEATRVSQANGPTAQQMEDARVAAIGNMCKATGMDDGLKQRWISAGTSFQNVSDEIMRIAEQRSKSNPKVSAGTLDLSAADTQRFSVVRAINAVIDKSWSKAGFEAECSREISKRLNTIPHENKFYVPYDVQQRPIGQAGLARHYQTMPGNQSRADVVATPSAGGYLVETVNLGFIDLLRNRAVAYRMGATQLSGLVGNVNVPKQTAAGTAFWLASETTQITEVEQTFGQMALSPHTVGAYTEISRLLLLQSSPGVEGIVNADLAAVAALALDKGALAGTGSSGQPTGIANVSGVGAISGANITAISYSGQLQYQVALANANVMPTRAGYVSTPGVAAFMMGKTRFPNTNTPLWDGNLWDANGAGGVAGFPGMSSNQMAANSIFFGDWSSLVVAEWGVLEIDVNPYANFQAGIIGIRAMMTIDIGLRYPAAFAVSSTTTS
jgi:HK97 family phage major capsid protein/HK97 family phage prohead protease